MTKPSLLLFDLGGVLTENAGFSQLNTLLPQPLDKQDLKQRWLLSSSVRAFELGELGAQDFARQFIQEWQLELSAEEFLLEFTAWSKGFYPNAQATLHLLRQEHRVACLSNSNPIHWQKFAGYENHFDIALFSHLRGVIKPDREAFMLAIDECAVKPSEIYYFDDSAANVEVAESLGMHAFLVEGFKALLQLLICQGLVAVPVVVE
ncbi:HAD-IA family hydrolase [Methylomonas sp. AM2-LC]|uniref:HAD-IA family hydrolase n=1 Tax=Methylomonas sp. AM2-LC TaxID=3153301 RepID=UPI0032665CBC